MSSEVYSAYAAGSNSGFRTDKPSDGKIQKGNPMKAYRSSIQQWFIVACAASVLGFGKGEMAAFGQGQDTMSASAVLNMEQQIQALTADKEQRTKTQQKLDSQLIYQARVKATGMAHPAVPELRPSLRIESDGRIKVDIKATVTPELLAAIKAAGGTILSSLPGYQAVQAVLPVEKMETIAARNEVVFISPAQKPRHNYIDSQGDVTHEAIQARASYPASGAGIKIGVLSDSLDDNTSGGGALAAAYASGNLSSNNPIFYLAGQEGYGTGEGLAMCEVVHDLAPNATIFFAAGDSSEAQMASNILRMAQIGCRIICDDVSYPDESPFQDGVIAKAVNTVCDMGVLYFSAAGNSGNYDAGTSGTWVGDFVNAGTVAGYGEQLQFYSGYKTDPITSPGTDSTTNTASLFWSDPLGASTNDYDLYLVNNSTGHIVYASTNPQNGTQDPYESFEDDGYNSGYSFAVFLTSGTNRYLHLDFGRGVLEVSYTWSVRGHNACDAPNSFTVAATPATDYGEPAGPYPNPFNSSDVVEYFSSDGPLKMFYNSDGTPMTPGNFSSTGGKGFLKPDFAAADGVSTTLPSGSLNPFFGTSCATPHAAAIAALVLSYNPGLTATQVHTLLTNSCIDIMTPGFDRDSGNGILMALKALQNTPPPNYFVPGSMTYSDTGSFQVALGGVVGSNYNIQVSSDLKTWSTLATLTMTNTTSIFTDNTASPAQRYYRAKLQ